MRILKTSLHVSSISVSSILKEEHVLVGKSTISYPYNNGLAESSVKKSKLTKRIMYGRSSFALLRAKLLLNKQFN